VKRLNDFHRNERTVEKTYVFSSIITPFTTIIVNRLSISQSRALISVEQNVMITMYRVE